MDLISNLKPFLSVAPQSSAAGAINGTAFDASNYGDVLAIVSAGTIDAATTVDAKLQESDSSSTGFTDVTGEAITQLGATDDDKLGTVLKYRRIAGSAKKYLRLVITVAGSGSAVVAGHLIGGNPKQAPVT